MSYEIRSLGSGVRTIAAVASVAILPRLVLVELGQGLSRLALDAVLARGHKTNDRPPEFPTEARSREHIAVTTPNVATYRRRIESTVNHNSCVRFLEIVRCDHPVGSKRDL